MFPNVRLLVGALFASVVALSCGFGLFAAFRVNHEPLSRLPVGTAPVQFVANEVAASRTGWGTPFDGQSRLNGSRHSEIAADASTAAPVGRASIEAENTGTAETIKPIAAATPVIESARSRAIEQPAEVIEPAVSITSAPAATSPAPTSPAPNQTASVPSPSVDTASGSASANSSPDVSQAQPTGTIAAKPATPPSESVPPPESAAPEQPKSMPAPKPDSASGARVKSAAAAIAAATPPDQPLAVTPPANEVEPSPVTAPAKAAAKPVRKIGATKDGKITRKLSAHRRVVLRRRIVHRLRRGPGQNSGFSDPVFQSAPNVSGASASLGGANSSSW